MSPTLILRIAYLDAHHRPLAHVMEHSKQRLLLLYDTPFPFCHLMHDLSILITANSQTVFIRHKPWHFLLDGNLRERCHHIMLKATSTLVRKCGPVMQYSGIQSLLQMCHMLQILTCSHCKEHVWSSNISRTFTLHQRELNDKIVALASCGGSDSKDFDLLVRTLINGL